MSVLALSVEPNFKVENNCSVLEEYNLETEPEEEEEESEHKEGGGGGKGDQREKLVDGKCTEKAFQAAYQK